MLTPLSKHAGAPESKVFDLFAVQPIRPSKRLTAGIQISKFTIECLPLKARLSEIFKSKFEVPLEHTLRSPGGCLPF